MPLYRIGKVWYIDLATQRGRIRRSSGTTDRRQAQAYYERLRAEQWGHEKLGKPLTVTWREAVKKWMEEKPRSLPERYMVNALGFTLDEPLPIKPETLNDALTGFSPASWNRSLNIIRAIHRLSGLEPPSVGRKPTPPGRTRYLTKKEWVRLRKALVKESPLLAQCADFALATGLRENNVLELRWSQVDLKRRTVVLEASAVKNRETLGIPLNDAAVAVLVARKGKDKVWVFSHPDSGRPLYKASNRAWYTAVRKAGLTSFRWHDLRHTWASWAVMNGVSLRELMELGGWKSYSMVQRYSHLSKDHLTAAVNKIKPV